MLEPMKPAPPVTKIIRAPSCLLPFIRAIAAVVE
jgi:hypothetical protein